MLVLALTDLASAFKSGSMKKFSLTLALLCALCAFAYAGPEKYSSGKEMKQVAPVPVECPRWSGFYVGGLVGYKYAVAESHVDLTGTWEEFPDTERNIQDRGERSFDESGAELGGLLGFNWQLGHWVIGAEAAGGYMWLRDSFSETFSDNEFESTVRVSGSFKTHYLATFGGRLGYAMCRWLPYVTGGLAIGDTDFDGQVLIQNDDGFRWNGGRSETRTGWFIGGGLEYMLTNHWRLRGQYQYIDLGSSGFTRDDNFDEGFITHRSVNLREHNVQLAIIYGF